MPKLPDITSFGARPTPNAVVPISRADTSAPARALTNFGQTVEGIGAEFARAQTIITNRQWAVDRARALSKFQQESTDDLIRTTSEQDLGDPSVLTKFGESLRQRQSDILGQHNGSIESRLQLEQQLESMRNNIASSAAAMSHQAQISSVDAIVGKQLSDLNAEVSRDPSKLLSSFEQLDSALSNVKDVYTPQQEEAHRNGGRAQLVTSALNTLILQGRFDDATNILDTAGTSEILGSDGWRRAHDNILTAKIALRNEHMKAIGDANSKLEFARTILGREPNSEERYAILFPTLAAQKAKPQSPESLFGRGVDGMSLTYMTQWSDAYKYGLTTPAQDKIFESAVVQYTQAKRFVNPDTGQLETQQNVLPPQVADAINARGFEIPKPVLPGPGISDALKPPGGSGEPKSGSDNPQPLPLQSQTAWSLADKSTGPVPFAAEQAGRTPIIGGSLPVHEFTQARNWLPQVQRDLVLALQNNPRYPEAERQAIESEVSIEPRVFDNPTAYRDRLIAIDQALQIRQRNAFERAQSPMIPSEQRSSAMNILDAITRFRRNLGVPPRIQNDDDYEKLKKLYPSGTEFIDPEGTVRRLP